MCYEACDFQAENRPIESACRGGWLAGRAPVPLVSLGPCPLRSSQELRFRAEQGSSLFSLTRAALGDGWGLTAWPCHRPPWLHSVPNRVREAPHTGFGAAPPASSREGAGGGPLRLSGCVGAGRGPQGSPPTSATHVVPSAPHRGLGQERSAAHSPHSRPRGAPPRSAAAAPRNRSPALRGGQGAGSAPERGLDEVGGAAHAPWAAWSPNGSGRLHKRPLAGRGRAPSDGAIGDCVRANERLLERIFAARGPAGLRRFSHTGPLPASAPAPAGAPADAQTALPAAGPQRRLCGDAEPSPCPREAGGEERDRRPHRGVGLRGGPRRAGQPSGQTGRRVL